MKRIITLLLCCLAIVSNTNAQTAASYLFSNIAIPGGYSSISAATGTVAAGTVVADDGVQTSIPIGFTFMFCGSSCTTLSACSNGWLSLSNSSAGTPTNYTNTAANAGSIAPGMLMPFWEDLVGTAGTSNAYYQTSGTAPNRVFTFEWKSWQEIGDLYVFTF